MFITSFLGVLDEYNMKFSDDLLDSTDFVPKIFEFLGRYDIHPPSKNVPKFLLKKKKTKKDSSLEQKEDLNMSKIYKISEKEEGGEKEEKKVQSVKETLKDDGKLQKTLDEVSDLPINPYNKHQVKLDDIEEKKSDSLTKKEVIVENQLKLKEVMTGRNGEEHEKVEDVDPTSRQLKIRFIR